MECNNQEGDKNITDLVLSIHIFYKHLNNFIVADYTMITEKTE